VSVADLNIVLLSAAAVLLAGVSAVRISTRAGLPSLLLYLAIGLAIGEAGLGLSFSDAELTQVLGSLALGIILAEGGFTTRWTVIRPVIGLAVVLATAGVAISVVVTTTIAYLALDVDLRTAILLGAVASSTDAAAVFAAMRQLPLLRRLRSVLEAESGFNDPPVIILVSVVTSDAWTQSSPLALGGMMVYQLLVGALVGLLVARASQWVLARSALPAAGLYPLATLAIALVAFAVAGLAGSSSFLAIYVAGLWLGNADLPHRSSTQGFVEASAWLAQIGLFVLLGLLASPQRLPQALLPALVVGGALLFVARPASILLCATPFRVPWKEQAFMSWAGLRGAVPIVLATIPMTVGYPGAERIFDVVFLLVVIFTLIQGPPLPFLARRLQLVETGATRELDIESAPLDELDATLLHVDVPRRSRLVGVAISELRLPGDAMITLIVRGQRLFVPDSRTVLRPGDRLMVVTSNDDRVNVERRMRAVSRAGRLARWRGEDGRAIGTHPRPDRQPPTAQQTVRS
jgi:potassium/hydrogen antiporter